jgi:membrane protein required for colicin V production
MNPLDIVIVAILSYCLIRGVFRGLIKELSAIVGVLAAFYAAYTYYPYLSEVLQRWISDVSYRHIASFFILFCAIFILISALGVVIQYLLDVAFLGWVDRLCGAAFGLIKGILICAVLVMALTAFLQKGTPLVKDSSLAPYINRIAENMAKVVSDDMKRQFDEKIDVLRKHWR